MRFEVCVHLLNDDEETCEVEGIELALQTLQHAVQNNDAAQVQFYQISPVHD